MRRHGELVVILGTLLATVSGCSFFQTEIVRPVQAVWSGDDLLVAVSSYQTSRPDQEYFNATAGEGWEIRLYRWPGGDSEKSIGPAVIPDDVFGGSIEYSRVHWHTETLTVSVDEWQSPYLLKLSGTAGWRKIPLEADPSLTNLLDLDVAASELTSTDTSLSPDGTTVAVLWHFAYFPADVFGPLYVNEIVTFYAASTGAFQYGARLNEAPPGGTSATRVGPLGIETLTPSKLPYPIDTDATVWSRLIWSADSSRIYAVDTVGNEAAVVVYDPATTPTPEATTQVPNSGRPTSSGPIRDDGRAAIVTFSGNESAISFTTVSGWEPFSAQSVIDIGSATY